MHNRAGGVSQQQLWMHPIFEDPSSSGLADGGQDLSPHPADAALPNFDYDDTKLMSQEKVLIVEDEENERSGLAELVGAWGYRTETAKDGAEGLEKFTSWSQAIVVTDI